MKKVIRFFVVAFVSVTLAGCNTTQKPEGDETIKVALMVGFLGDLSFNDSANQGMEQAKQELGMDIKVIEYGDDVSKLESTLLATADEGFDVIIGPSNFSDYFGEHAETYPDTTFILFDATADYSLGSGLKNVYSIVYSANEASFAAGFLAAKQSESGVIGFLGGEEAPVINDFLVGYIEGAKNANPDVKVAVSFVGNWFDSAKGKELSFAMINQKADIIFGAAGGATMGIFEAGVEKEIQAIGVDFDQALVFENENKLDFAEVTISSVMKNVGDSLFRALEMYQNGTLKTGEADVLGIKENGVGLADNKFYEAAVDESIRNEVAEFIKKISDGEIQVTSYYDMDNADFNTLKESVRP